VEGLNRAVEGIFLAALPGYARQPRPGKRASRPKDEVLLSFEDFTARLLDWTRWWNTEDRPAPLRGSTPLEAWQEIPPRCGTCQPQICGRSPWKTPAPAR
jgi:putative transposase